MADEPKAEEKCSACGGSGFVEADGYITNYCGKCWPKTKDQEQCEDAGCNKFFECLRAILKPDYGNAEFILDAAKRCAAMAEKLPRAQKKRAKLVAEVRRLRRLLGLTESARLTFRREASDLGRWLKIADAELKNWRRKAARIAAALGVHNGETLVSAAERVAQERGEWKKVKEYWKWQVKKLEEPQTPPAYAALIRRVEEAEAHAASFERIANELRAELKKQESITAADAIQEFADAHAKFTGMSTAKVDPHSAPPQEKVWE